MYVKISSYVHTYRELLLTVTYLDFLAMYYFLADITLLNCLITSMVFINY